MDLSDMDLSHLRKGELARITEIDGGFGIRQKLNLRGIIEGSIVRVISLGGPVTIEIDRNIISIGRSMAKKIRVIRM